MRVTGKKVLLKLKFKNQGNLKLCKAIDELILTIEEKNWKTKEEIRADRSDADQVHTDGFYFFDINVHRALVLIQLNDDGKATIVWAGTHDNYERVFKNTKSMVKKYLSDNSWI
ncbi:type II toxin-antitoxin system HigB family toxin [Pedobacter hiemivivus]|uniref:Type II toxin-antitoxin system HigB family toxin n=1 Tax=Pedobacter hiemivivus TaxID=2530454 RepID=A0A4R0N471_9SPHI|nr:type II toxin-antitoxin system HigB family toxin [Pedobacter hiemivivus]TCC94650.1 type II toxin-antitoxin system HigB family toxin [Pedobacter hiemivivus]